MSISKRFAWDDGFEIDSSINSTVLGFVKLSWILHQAKRVAVEIFSSLDFGAAGDQMMYLN